MTQYIDKDIQRNLQTVMNVPEIFISLSIKGHGEGGRKQHIGTLFSFVSLLAPE